MSETFILIIVIVVTFYLAKHAITEVQRIEQQKKFHRNMNNFDKKKK